MVSQDIKDLQDCHLIIHKIQTSLNPNKSCEAPRLDDINDIEAFESVAKSPKCANDEETEADLDDYLHVEVRWLTDDKSRTEGSYTEDILITGATV